MVWKKGEGKKKTLSVRREAATANGEWCQSKWSRLLSQRPCPSPSSPLSFLFLKPDLCSAVSRVKVYRVRLDTASLHLSSLEVWKYSAPRPPPPFSSSPASFYPKLSVHFLINNHIRGWDLRVSTHGCLTWSTGETLQQTTLSRSLKMLSTRDGSWKKSSEFQQEDWIMLFSFQKRKTLINSLPEHRNCNELQTPHMRGCSAACFHRISVLKSCTSVLVSSSPECFQSFSVFQKPTTFLLAMRRQEDNSGICPELLDKT